MSINAYFRGEERSITNCLTLHLNELNKRIIQSKSIEKEERKEKNRD